MGARYLESVEAVRGALPKLRSIVLFEGGETGALGFERLLADAGEHEEEADVEDDETTILMYTSGTTSLPKGVMLSHGDFSAYVTANVELADGTPRGAALPPSPPR